MKRRLGLPRNVWVAGGVSLLNDASSEMVYPLLPLFITSVLGASRASLGLIEGVAEAVASLLKVASGAFSDRLRTRKLPMFLGYGLSLASRPFIAAAGTWHAVFGARFADRCGKGIRTAPRDAVLAESASPDARGLAFGVHRAMDTLGAALGPAAALLLLGALRLDMRSVFWISILPGAGALFLILFIKDDARPFRSSEPRAGLKGLPRGAFRDFLWVTALFTLSNSSDTFLLLKVRSVGFDAAGVVGVFMVFNIVYAAVAGPIGALADRWGARRVTAFSFFYYGALYAGFALAGSGVPTVTLLLLYGPFQAMEEGVKKAYVSGLLPPEKLATGMGIYHAVRGFALLPASLLTGVLWDRFGPAAAFGADAVLALVAGFLFLGFILGRSRGEESP